jgi:hypothetical protein
MSSMPSMLAYTIQGGLLSDYQPIVIVGQGSGMTGFSPESPQDDSYWWLILDATNPTKMVAQFLAPGLQNTTVPDGLDAYMSNPQYIFALVTQNLSTIHVPQGPLYDYMVQYGAGGELQRLEQINTTLSCGTFSSVSYVLTGQCGVSGQNPPPPAYEQGSIFNPVVLTMSLMPDPVTGQGPYSITDSNTFLTS